MAASDFFCFFDSGACNVQNWICGCNVCDARKLFCYECLVLFHVTGSCNVSLPFDFCDDKKGERYEDMNMDMCGMR